MNAKKITTEATTATTETNRSTPVSGTSSMPLREVFLHDSEENFKENVRWILSEYDYKIGGSVTRYQLDSIVNMVKELPIQAIEYAINQTARAPRPSYRYFEVIINRIKNYGWDRDFQAQRQIKKDTGGALAMWEGSLPY